MNSSYNFSYDKTQKFQCQMCGECCNAWKIPVETELYQTLQKVSWVRQLLQKHHKDFYKMGDQYYLPKVQGICIFLNEEKRCLLHQEGLKPKECQRFPFALAQWEQEIYVDTSFYCKSILENTGQDLAESVTENFITTMGTFPLSAKMSSVTPPDVQQDASHPFHLALWLRKKRPLRDFWKLYWKKGIIEDPILCENIYLPSLRQQIFQDKSQLTQRYYNNILSRKALIAHGYSQNQILKIAHLASMLIEYYAKAITSILPENLDDDFPVKYAVRIVERYYIGHNARFLELFCRFGKY